MPPRTPTHSDPGRGYLLRSQKSIQGSSPVTLVVAPFPGLPRLAAMGEAEREPGDVQFDDESGEGDSISVERDFDLARAAAARAIVEEIDLALSKIPKKTFGICETSGLAIPKERLRAIPWARERVEVKTRAFG